MSTAHGWVYPFSEYQASQFSKPVEQPQPFNFEAKDTEPTLCMGATSHTRGNYVETGDLLAGEDDDLN